MPNFPFRPDDFDDDTPTPAREGDADYGNLPSIKTPREQAMREMIDGQMGRELREKDATIAALRQEIENLQADAGNDAGKVAAYKNSLTQMYEAIGIPRDFRPWPEYIANVSEEIATLRADLKLAQECEAAFHDEARQAQEACATLRRERDDAVAQAAAEAGAFHDEQALNDVLRRERDEQERDLERMVNWDQRQQQVIHDYAETTQRLLRERDEARAEVRRLKDYITLRPAYDSPIPATAPAQPSAELSCPVHHSYVRETDGTRHCNFDGCDWSVPGAASTEYPAATPERLALGWCPECGIYNRVGRCVHGYGEPLPAAAQSSAEGLTPAQAMDELVTETERLKLYPDLEREAQIFDSSLEMQMDRFEEAMSPPAPADLVERAQVSDWKHEWLDLAGLLDRLMIRAEDNKDRVRELIIQYAAVLHSLLYADVNGGLEEEYANFPDAPEPDGSSRSSPAPAHAQPSAEGTRHLTLDEQATMKRALRASSRLIAEGASPLASADLVERAADVIKSWAFVGDTTELARQSFADLKQRIAAALAAERADATRRAYEKASAYIEQIKILREHAGMSTIENMQFLLETTAEEIRALSNQPPDTGDVK